MIGPRDLPELRDFIRSRRAALFGFMEQGAARLREPYASRGVLRAPTPGRLKNEMWKCCCSE
jgi:hypothetical protein